MSGARLANRIAARLKSRGLANRFTLVVRPTNAEHEFVCRPITNAKGYTHKTGSLIEEGERVFTVFNTAGVTPTTSDKARLYGDADEWQITRVDPNDFDEEPVSWLVKVMF